jgi:hypothetical protein
MDQHHEPDPLPLDAPACPRRRPWSTPEIAELPRLTELTLQTGDPIEGIGSTGGGGSTVF